MNKIIGPRNSLERYKTKTIIVIDAPNTLRTFPLLSKEECPLVGGRGGFNSFNPLRKQAVKNFKLNSNE